MERYLVARVKRLPPLVRGLEAGVQCGRRGEAFGPDALEDFIVLMLLIRDHLHVAGGTF